MLVIRKLSVSRVVHLTDNWRKRFSDLGGFTVTYPPVHLRFATSRSFRLRWRI